ncbi:tolQ protein [Planctomycetales bacterium]|nr:tolQ protein [Planctomycetales bacterium]
MPFLFAQVVQGAANPNSESLLFWYFSACGIFFGPLFILISIVFVTLTVMNWLAISRNGIAPKIMLDEFDKHCEAKEYQNAYEVALHSDSALGRILAAGLAKLSKGFKIAEQAMNDAAEAEIMALEHRLSHLGTIATVSPMVGLLGTVWGMVDAFSVIARSGAAPNASELASGISLALVTTQVGLLIAIPALILFEILKNRLARLILEMTVEVDNRMERFSHHKER